MTGEQNSDKPMTEAEVVRLFEERTKPSILDRASKYVGYYKLALVVIGILAAVYSYAVSHIYTAGAIGLVIFAGFHLVRFWNRRFNPSDQIIFFLLAIVCLGVALIIELEPVAQMRRQTKPEEWAEELWMWMGMGWVWLAMISAHVRHRFWKFVAQSQCYALEMVIRSVEKLIDSPSDLTARQVANSNLQASQTQLRKLFEMLSDSPKLPQRFLSFQKWTATFEKPKPPPSGETHPSSGSVK